MIVKKYAGCSSGTDSRIAVQNLCFQSLILLEMKIKGAINKVKSTPKMAF